MNSPIPVRAEQVAVSPNPSIRRAVLWFTLVLAGITGVVMAPLWLTGASPDAFNAVVPVMSWAPALAAVAAWFASGRRVPFTQWAALRPFRTGRTLRTAGLMLAVFVAVPAVTTTTALAVGIVAWQPTPEAFGLLPLVLPYALLAMLMTTGEEIGWRGALQTALTPLGPWKASIVIALAWSLWHLPLTLGFASGGGLSMREVVATSINLVIAGCILSGARLLSGSMWSAAWAHALMNTTLVFAASNLVTPSTELGTGAYWALQVINWTVLAAVALVCVWLSQVVAAAPRISATVAPPARRRQPAREPSNHDFREVAH